MRLKRSPRLQAGFTLVEVLVSVTLGLVILTAIAVVFQTSSNLQRQREDTADVTEPARMITGLLKYNISQAGFIDLLDNTPGSANLIASTVFVPGDTDSVNMFVRNPATAIVPPIDRLFQGILPVFGCDGAMASTPNALAVATPPVTTTCGTANALQNSVQFAYQAIRTSTSTSPTSTLPLLNTTVDETAAAGEGRDCLQQRPYNPATPTNLAGANGIVINRFYIATSPGDGVNELYCAGSGNSVPQPLVRGVEEFVVRYQIAQAGSGSAAAGAGKTQFLTAALVAANSVGWPGVSAIEICMVTATAQSSLVNDRAAATGTTQLQTTRPTCDRNSSGAFKANIARASGDVRLWMRNTFTYSVRNAVFASPI